LLCRYSEVRGSLRTNAENHVKNLLAQIRWPRGRALASAAAPVAAERRPDARLRHHAALVYLSRRAMLASPSTSLLGDVCRIAARVLGVDHVHVLELLPDTRTLIARAAAGWPPERLAHWQMEVSPDTRLGQALRTSGLVVLDEATDAGCSQGGGDLLSHLRMQCGLAAVVAPISDARALFGVYSAGRRRFTRDDLQFVRAVAQIVESALQREAEMITDRAARATSAAFQAELLRVVVGRLRPALRESVGCLWNFRTNPTDSFTFRRAVKQTERQVASVADFIEDLSLLADLLEGRAPGRRTILVAPVLSSLVDQLTHRADLGGVTLKLEIADELIGTAGDSALLRRALLNLIDNALRFTAEAGTVTVALSSRDPSAAVIEVTDSGRGMTATQLNRLSNNDEGVGESEHRGPGIGWRLASAIVQAHGGTLTASSPGPTLGTTIAVRLPRLSLADFNLPESVE
jgi:signal transduction histidine kinase